MVYEEDQATWVTAKYHIDFLGNGKVFILSSDKSGWNHLYRCTLDGKLVNQVTDGNLAVADIIYTDEVHHILYFTAERENTEKMGLFKVGFDGTGLTRLTSEDYSYQDFSFSPNGRFIIATRSNLSSPPAMELLDCQGKIIRELGDSRTPQFGEFDWAKKELTYVKSKDGLFDLPMVITYPIHFDPNKRYPVLMEVYGGPGAGHPSGQMER